MESTYFDPLSTIKGIKQLLVSDKKKIAFLFGAGTSLSKKFENSPNIPAVDKMTEKVIRTLECDKTNGEKYKCALKEIKEEITEQGYQFNIETLLSNVEEKILVIGKGNLNSLTREDFCSMKNLIRDKIREIVSVHSEITGKEKDTIQYDFAKWICNADRKYGVEIFTTNYDYLLEIGLEANHVPYYDGFSGSYKPFFNSSALDDIEYLSKETKLWKIHGSLGLSEEDNGQIVRLTSDTNALMIYPSSIKYSESKKQPYASFMDRLNLFLKQDDAVLFVCGYSFNDEHINERIISALKTNTTAHVFVLNYDIVTENLDGSDIRKSTFSLDSNLGKLASQCRKISALSTRNAIIGGQWGKWKINSNNAHLEDSLSLESYYKEDIIEETVPGTDNKRQVNMGTGELALPNFVSFVNLLKDMIPTDEWEVSNDE